MFYCRDFFGELRSISKLLGCLEAAIEPMNKGFAEIFSHRSLKNMKAKYIQGQYFKIFRVLPWSSVDAGVYYIFYYSRTNSRLSPSMTLAPSAHCR
jgi:hypothetical protein